MTGSKQGGMVLQDRDRHLLSELGTMRVIDRETAKQVASFGSTTRANTRLLQLVRAGLLRRFFVGSVGAGRKSVYTLSAKGGELASARLPGVKRASGRLIVGDRFIEHQFGVNQIYLALKYAPTPCPDFRLLRWRAFRQPLSEAIKLTPDGYFEVEAGKIVRPMFLEVDLGTEALKVWQQKTSLYIQLAVAGQFQKLFRQPQFRVLVIAASERRLKHLREAIAKQTDKIFWFTTFESINARGLFSPIWLRPKGDQLAALL